MTNEIPPRPFENIDAALLGVAEARPRLPEWDDAIRKLGPATPDETRLAEYQAVRAWKVAGKNEGETRRRGLGTGVWWKKPKCNAAAPRRNEKPGNDGSMAKTASRVNYGLWLLRVAGWDGLLPVGVGATPYLIEMLLPHRLGVAITVVVSVILPPAAFQLRIRFGKNHIASNGCSTTLRRLQYFALYIGLLPLALIDGMLIFCHTTPKGFLGLFETPADWVAFAFCVGTYVTAMVVAMYPGSSTRPRDADDETALEAKPV